MMSFRRMVACKPKPQNIRQMSSLPGYLDLEVSGLPRSERPGSVGDVKVTTLPNGLKVATYDTYGPLASVGMFYKAGTADNDVLANILRRNLWMSSEKRSQFAVQRTMEFFGNDFTTNTYREHTSSYARVTRDADQIAGVVDIFAGALEAPLFMNFEFQDAAEEVVASLRHGDEDPDFALMSDLNRVCYSGQLGNYVVPPSFRFGRSTVEQMKEFQLAATAPKNSVLVGVCVDHDTLVQIATEKLGGLSGSGAVLPIGPSKFTPGRETRHDTDSPASRVILGYEGPKSFTPTDQKASVLHYALGSGTNVKWGTDHSKFTKDAHAVMGENPFNVQTSNVSYTRGGIFAVDFTCQGDQMDKLFGSIKNTLSSIQQGGLSDAEVSRGKALLKGAIVDASSNPQCLIEDIGKQVLFNGAYQSPSSVLSEVEGISTADVNAIAKNMGKPSMVASGELFNTPYVSSI